MNRILQINSPRILEVGVKVFIRNDVGKFLILKRTQPYHGQKIRKWDIPGGRIILGENQFTALRREVKEETGLKITKGLRILTVQDILRVPNKHTIRITYQAHCRSASIVIINPLEHSDYRWAFLAELQKLQHDTYLNEPIKQLIEEGD